MPCGNGDNRTHDHDSPRNQVFLRVSGAYATAEQMKTPIRQRRERHACHGKGISGDVRKSAVKERRADMVNIVQGQRGK